MIRVFIVAFCFALTLGNPAPLAAHEDLVGTTKTPAYIRDTRALTADEQAAQALLDAWCAALNSGDMAQIEALVTTDDGFSMFESGLANLGWHDYRETHLRPELAGFAQVNLAMPLIVFQDFGEAGFASFGFEVSYQVGEDTHAMRSLGSALLFRDGAAWKIRHMHTSRAKSDGSMGH